MKFHDIDFVGSRKRSLAGVLLLVIGTYFDISLVRGGLGRSFGLTLRELLGGDLILPQ